MLTVSDVENPMVGPGEVMLLGAVPKPNFPFEKFLLDKEQWSPSVSCLNLILPFAAGY